MKEYLITLFLLVLITACAPIVEEQSVEEVVEDVVEETDVEGGFIEDIQVEEPKEVVEEIILEEPEMEEIPLKEEVVIEIKSDSFYPTEKSIKTNTEIKWVNKDSKQHKIACYLGGTRVTTSSNLDNGDYFTYNFLKGGEYTCIDAIYGLRSTVMVEEERQPLLSPTGSVVIGTEGNTMGASIAAIALIAIVLSLFLVYVRKRQ